MSPALNVFSGFRDPIHTVASNSIDAANATLGDGANHAHQLCFTGSAATRPSAPQSTPADGSITGRPPSSACTERNSFPRTCHVAHEFRSVHALLDELPMIEPSAAFDLRVHA